MGTTHAEIIRSPTLLLTKTRRLQPKISHLDSSDQRTDFHQSNVHCLCFLAQASLLFLLVSFSSGFFAAIRPWRPDSCSLLWTVDVEMCLSLELCEEFIWAAISEAVNSNELILCSRGNSGSSFPVAVLMRASFILVFATALEETFKVYNIFQIDWSLSNDGLLFIFAYLSCSCHNMDLVFCIPPPPCHNTTDWLKHIKKEIDSTN